MRIRFSKWQAPTTRGPELSIDADDIVAIEQTDFDQTRGAWRTRLHLRGGTQMVVDSDFDAVEFSLARARAESRMIK